ncbi:MAG: HD-GYP domain-containing protein [Isosphaeraceae bacterium]
MTFEHDKCPRTSSVAELGLTSPASSLELAQALGLEFTAPVGIFEPVRRRWVALIGAGESFLPDAHEVLRSDLISDELRSGEVELWRGHEALRRIWLVFAVPSSDGRTLAAFIGFLSPGHPSGSQLGPKRRPGDRPPDGVNWGMPCPEPALRAWGREVANRLRTTAGGMEHRKAPADRDEESERQVVGRLIRRLRISVAPQDFQSIATTVVRTSLNVEAVAWVPKSPSEPVVVSGRARGLDAHAYRALPAPSGRESTFIERCAPAKMADGAPAALRGYASVAAGQLGWLLAVNPLDDRALGASDIERLQFIASLIATQLSNVKIYAEIKDLLFGIIRALTAAIDAKDPYTSGHSERVARIAVRLAEELGMPAPKRSDLYLAGLLHDIGKIGVRDDVLQKVGPLTPEEFRKIQCHVEIGVTILKDLKKLSHILPGVRHHHESLDGTGYPDHLSGDDIPFEARILAVADSFDAMSSNRPYRKRLSLAQIDKIFHEGRSVQWDPNVVDALFACRGDLEAIRQKGLGESLIGAVNVTLGRN